MMWFPGIGVLMLADFEAAYFLRECQVFHARDGAMYE